MKNELKKMTKGAIVKRISELSNQIRDINNAVEKDPKVVEARKVYNIAINTAREEALKKTNPLRDESSKLLGHLSIIQEAEFQSIPANVTNHINTMKPGVDWGPKAFNVKWVSPSKHFIIATNKGHMYSSCRSMKYGQAKHYLFDITKVDNADHGVKVRDNCAIFEVEGRLTKEKMAEWQKFAKDSE